MSASRATVFGPLVHLPFRFFFVGTVCSNFALWMQQFALGWLAVELALGDGQSERSSFYIGLLGLARLVPALLFGPVGGVAADLYDRRRVLLASRTATAIVIGLLAALAISGQATIAFVFVLVAFAALVTAFESPARLALVPMLVPAHLSFSAISLTRATMMVSGLIGPLLGGLLIVPFGVGGVLVVSTVLYALSGFGLDRITSMPPIVRAAVGPLESMRIALRYVNGDPALKGLMIATLALNVFAASVAQLLPAFVHDALHAGAVELSWLAAAGGLGAFFGAMTVATMVSWRRPGWVIVGAVLGLGLSQTTLSFQSAIAPAVLLCVLSGYAQLICFGGNGSIVQVATPDELRGRVMGLWLMVFNVGFQLGTLILGALGSFIGISPAITVGGAIVIGIGLVMSRVSAIRDVGERRIFAAS